MTYRNDVHSSDRASEARAWPKILGRFREPNQTRSVFEIVITIVPLVALWATMWALVEHGYAWLSFALAIPAGGFLVRLFLIQHDCSHGAFFQRRDVNDWVGRVLGVFTLTPYDYWRRAHAIHHATHGNLDQRGMGDITTLTVEEYRARGFWGRMAYRTYRNPVVLFVLGPAYMFLLQHRLPIGMMRAGSMPWVSTMGTNLGIAVLYAGLIWLVGIGPFLMIQLPIVIVAASIGVWLFYVQHQFEETFWARPPEWTHQEAALHGSSYYDLPGVLRWMTANIGVHHVHHLSSRIPYYRLPEVLRQHPELMQVGRITISESIRAVRLVLWDEDRQQLVPFKAMRRWQPVNLPIATETA
jgi:omega-6 fatty acid desaturase (delta-12 desaturase)